MIGLRKHRTRLFRGRSNSNIRPAGHPIVRAVVEHSAELRPLTDRDLRGRTEQLRERVAAGQLPGSDEIVAAGFALINEAARRAIGISFYDVQLLAGWTLSRGFVAEMQTGEGKTFVAALPAFVHSLTGQGVHVVTSNAYLAERDFETLLPVFELLGVSAGLLEDGAAPARKRDVYACDITYGTGYEFGFDYLRDQVALRKSSQSRLGDAFLERLRGNVESAIPTVQRGLNFAIIDEVDSVLIDDASSPLILSDQPHSTPEDANAHLAAREMIAHMNCPEDYLFTPATGTVRLTDAGAKRIYAESPDDVLPVAAFKVLKRPWSAYIQQALRAAHVFRRGVHYIVEEGEVRIVDEFTGRIFTERSWSDGLHQAVEAKEGVEITAEKQALARITRQRFFRLYEGLCGMTGTATGSEREFWEFYRLRVESIPLHKPSQRAVLPPRYFADADSKWQAVADELKRLHEVGRPVLVGTRTIANSESLAALIDAYRLPYRLLNGQQDMDEAMIVGQAGEPAAITIATNMAGRGTDIKVGPEVLKLGGLHVIGTERHESQRIDRQLIGRTARQGDPGSAQFFLSADDDLILRHSDWLHRTLKESADAHGSVPLEVDAQIDKVQLRVDRAKYAQRRQLFRFDHYRDSVMAKLAGEE